MMCGLPIKTQPSPLARSVVGCFVVRQIGPQDLDGDFLIDDLMAGQVDDPMPPSPSRTRCGTAHRW